MTINKSQNIGIYYMVYASLLFSLATAFAKLLSASMGSVEITFFRNLIGAFVIGATAIGRPIVKKSGGKPFTLIFRGIIGTLALLAYFYTVSKTSLAHAVIYAKTEPIFTALLAYFLLKEHISRQAVLSIALGFCGVVLIAGGFDFGYVDMLGIMSGLFAALAYTSVRELREAYDERTVVMSFIIAGTVLPLVLMGCAEFFRVASFEFLLQPFTMPKGSDWFFIALLGVSAAYGQIYMTRAYFFAKAGLASSASYSIVLFSTLFGLLLGDAVPTAWMLVGMILIVAGGLLVGATKR